MNSISSSDKVMLLLVLIPLLMFGGTPDLMDGLIEFLQEYNDE
jgi:hypothetical protein